LRLIEFPRSTLLTHWSGEGISSLNRLDLLLGVGFYLLSVLSNALKAPTEVLLL